jgi:hypothetical protein
MAKTRLQFDFTEDALSELDELKSVTGASNRAEVIRQALRLLQWTIVQTKENDGTILVEKNGVQREVIFPFLSSVKPAFQSKWVSRHKSCREMISATKWPERLGRALRKLGHLVISLERLYSLQNQLTARAQRPESQNSRTSNITPKPSNIWRCFCSGRCF